MVNKGRYMVLARFGTPSLTTHDSLFTVHRPCNGLCPLRRPFFLFGLFDVRFGHDAHEAGEG
ncbi:MAG: hypothetical protein P8Z49_08450, partial [Acidobacteriota bacterium]